MRRKCKYVFTATQPDKRSKDNETSRCVLLAENGNTAYWKYGLLQMRLTCVKCFHFRKYFQTGKNSKIILQLINWAKIWFSVLCILKNKFNYGPFESKMLITILRLMFGIHCWVFRGHCKYQSYIVIQLLNNLSWITTFRTFKGKKNCLKNR